MLAGSKATRVPTFLISAIGFSLSFSEPRPLTTMLQPSLASASAMACPMPEVEPVTTAVLPLRLMTTSRVARETCVGNILPQRPLLEHDRRDLCGEKRHKRQLRATTQVRVPASYATQATSGGNCHVTGSQACVDGAPTAGHSEA